MAAAPSAWSELPLELLGAILLRLTFTDHHRFSAVCASWRAAARSRLFPPVGSLAPWLMLPDNLAAARRRPSRSASFYSLSERRLYRILLPDPPISSRVCIGSAAGWLVTIAERCELHLLNPVTRAQIPLPPIDAHHPFDGMLSFIKAAIWLSPTSSAERTGYMVALLYAGGRSVAVTREGDKHWTTIRLRRLKCVSDGLRRRCRTATDITFHKGKLHVVDPVEGTIAAWLPFPDTTNLSATATRFPWNVSKNWCYLAESAGELLLVARETAAIDPYGVHFRTTRFCVFRLGETWRSTTVILNLGDDVLFVGGNQSVAVSAEEFPELRRNCVYFTEMLQSSRCCPVQLPDMGVYSLHERRVDPFTDDDSLLAWPPPIWLTPSPV